ncbi:MAG: glycosyltransferase family 2 protein [Actinobacteria bacterium]|nr:glycosyltransferase family 2 protein [Actinomycetota bacterium]
MEIYLSIIIPCFNEQNRISPTIEKIIEYFHTVNQNYEIIVVDDGSTDNTAAVVNNTLNGLEDKMLRCRIVLLKNDRNYGKGYSVRKGVLASNGKLILFTDADLSTPIEEIEKFYNFKNNGYDIVIGSRGLKQSHIIKRQIKIREIMGKTFNFMVRKITGLEFFDTQCGFKLFDRNSVDRIFPLLKIDDYSFDVEILYVAKKMGFLIKEVPVEWINSEDSKVAIIKDSLKMLKSILKIKKIHS